jgi:hypothetical protein
VNIDKHIGIADFEVLSVKLTYANVSNTLFTKENEVTLVTVINV